VGTLLVKFNLSLSLLPSLFFFCFSLNCGRYTESEFKSEPQFYIAFLFEKLKVLCYNSYTSAPEYVDVEINIDDPDELVVCCCGGTRGLADGYWMREE
jgi:hypothetical protein